MGGAAWNMKVRECKRYFLKWGEYMKRAQLAERKVLKLKRLILLTDDSVSKEPMNELSGKQWMEFVREFPDEGHKQ